MVERSRPGRVRLTKEMENKLLARLVKEGDFDKKKKHPAKWYREKVALDLKLSDAKNPTLRTYESVLGPLRNQLRTKDILDEPWSIGGYMQKELEPLFKLTSEDNLNILKVHKWQITTAEISKRLSIRQALWIVRLVAIVDYISKGVDREHLLWECSFQYAVWEKVCKVRGEELYTRDLDDALLDGFETFKKVYEKRVFANWHDYEGFYNSHYLNGYSKKDGEQK